MMRRSGRDHRSCGMSQLEAEARARAARTPASTAGRCASRRRAWAGAGRSGKMVAAGAAWGGQLGVNVIENAVFAPTEWATLRFAPFWVLAAFAGRQRGFDTI